MKKNTIFKWLVFLAVAFGGLCSPLMAGQGSEFSKMLTQGKAELAGALSLAEEQKQAALKTLQKGLFAQSSSVVDQEPSEQAAYHLLLYKTYYHLGQNDQALLTYCWYVDALRQANGNRKATKIIYNQLRRDLSFKRLQEGQQKAQIVLENFDHSDREEVQYKLFLGRFAQARKDAAGMEYYGRELFEKHSDSEYAGEGLKLLVTGLYMQRRMDEAAFMADRLEKLYPKTTYPSYAIAIKGLTAQHAGDLDWALHQYRRALKEYPGNPYSLWLQNKIKEIEETLVADTVEENMNSEDLF